VCVNLRANLLGDMPSANEEELLSL
jgi:hypothetical protein